MAGAFSAVFMLLGGMIVFGVGVGLFERDWRAGVKWGGGMFVAWSFLILWGAAGKAIYRALQ